MKLLPVLSVTLTIVAIGAIFDRPVFAAAAAPATPAEARYQQDRANCLAGKTNQDQPTCLKEAGAALQAAREHDLKSANAAQLAANARKRCEPMTGDDRKACLARAEGEGTTTGSVAAGGELHEYKETVPGVQPDTTAPAATPLPPTR